MTALADTEVITMQAAVLTAPRQLSLMEVAVPVPAAGQVRLRVEGCGLCASSLPIYQGRDWFNYPVAAGEPGHEVWGTIDALGAGVDQWSLGERVTGLSYRGYGEYDVAEAAQLLRLSPKLADQPFPGEALGCAINVFRRSKIEPGDTVAVVGVGFMGALLIQLAKHAGARVIAVSRRPFSLDIARQCGADGLVTMDDHHRIIAQVEQLTQGNFCDKVIECTGLEWPLNLSSELCKVRGRLIIAGFHQDGMRQVNVQLWNWRGLDVINAHERDPAAYVDGIREAVEAVRTGRLQPQSLYTHSFSLDEIEQAFEHLEQRPDGFVKALITI